MAVSLRAETLASRGIRFVYVAKIFRTYVKWLICVCHLQVQTLTVDQVLTLRQVLSLLGLSEVLANRVHDLVSI